MGIREQGDLPIRILDDNYAEAVGNRSIGYCHFTGNVADTETITVGGRIFEFDNDSTITAGNITVDVSAGLTPAIAHAAFITAVNGDAHTPVTAFAMTGNIVALVSDDDQATALPLAEATTNVVISAATMTNGAATATNHIIKDTYTITAADVTALAVAAGTSEICVGAGMFSSGAPELVGLLIRDTNHHIRADFVAGDVSFLWKQIGTGHLYVLCVTDANTGATPLAANDAITWVAMG